VEADEKGDGRIRYPEAVRVDIYRHLLSIARLHAPELAVALCLEEPQVFTALGLESRLGRCNCVL
jgi:hypothetical protein